MPGLPGGYTWATFVRDIEGRSLSPQDQLTLIELKGEPSYEDFVSAKKIVRTELSRLGIRIAYRNVYNDRMPTITRRLDWFSRH
jgi:hypothetical protein